jgi:regulator of nonsense transcripts 1
MPRPIGSFISDHVYGGALETVHNITSKACCRLVDVETGREKPSGNSWAVCLSVLRLKDVQCQYYRKQNFQELRAVISIARQYNKQGKSYRIITPYDAQRNAIEKELQTAKLPWQDKCFNVDSFQGMYSRCEYAILALMQRRRE